MLWYLLKITTFNPKHHKSYSKECLYSSDFNHFSYDIYWISLVYIQSITFYYTNNVCNQMNLTISLVSEDLYSLVWIQNTAIDLITPTLLFKWNKSFLLWDFILILNRFNDFAYDIYLKSTIYIQQMTNDISNNVCNQINPIIYMCYDIYWKSLLLIQNTTNDLITTKLLLKRHK